MCIDYIKPNNTTRKDHYPPLFIDQMLDSLAGHPHYCFLNGYSSYSQNAIAPEDWEKTTFTFPYGTFAFKRMPFGLCNSPATFQMGMMSMFSDLVEEAMEYSWMTSWYMDAVLRNVWKIWEQYFRGGKTRI